MAAEPESANKRILTQIRRRVGRQIAAIFSYFKVQAAFSSSKSSLHFLIQDYAAQMFANILLFMLIYIKMLVF